MITHGNNRSVKFKIKSYVLNLNTTYENFDNDPTSNAENKLNKFIDKFTQ